MQHNARNTSHRVTLAFCFVLWRRCRLTAQRRASTYSQGNVPRMRHTCNHLLVCRCLGDSVDVLDRVNKRCVAFILSKCAHHNSLHPHHCCSVSHLLDIKYDIFQNGTKVKRFDSPLGYHIQIEETLMSRSFCRFSSTTAAGATKRTNGLSSIRVASPRKFREILPSLDRSNAAVFFLF